MRSFFSPKAGNYVKSFRESFLQSPWWGKLLGAFFGYLMGRSLGALFGIIIGNLFDRGLMSHFTRPHWSYLAEKRKEVQKKFFEATFSVMGHIAKADGRVSEQEILMAKKLMQEMLLKREQVLSAQTLFNQGKSPNFHLERVLQDLKHACRENPSLLKLFLDIQYRAAMVDGLTHKKIKALDKIFSILGFAPLHKQYRFYQDFDAKTQEEQSSSYSYSSHYQKPKQSSSMDTLEQAFALLEIPLQSTQAEVKKAYRRLMSKNHPDKLIAQGLPESMIKIANEKTQKIRKAYEHICTNKGWNF